MGGPQDAPTHCPTPREDKCGDLFRFGSVYRKLENIVLLFVILLLVIYLENIIKCTGCL